MGSRILNAECEAGVVKFNGAPVNGVSILSEGLGKSEGALFLDHREARYIASNASDIKEAIEKTVEAINKIGEILNAIGGGMTGPSTAPPPTLPTDVVALNSIGSELTELMGRLK